MANAGMMSESMFVSKTVLLSWLNDTLALRLERVEDTCTGAVACQLMDVLHPGSVAMKRVDWNAKHAHEFEKNYKELQQAFNKTGIERHFNVQQLSKGKLQDNVEFMQFFKGYWDSVTGGQPDYAADYDAVGRRAIGRTGDWKRFSAATSAAAGGAPRRPAAPPGSAGVTARVTVVGGGAKPAAPPAAAAADKAAPPAALRAELAAARAAAEEAQRERDFYFEKLRFVEIMCQAPELAAAPVMRHVERVLYAADGAEARAALAECEREFGAALIVEDGAPAPVAA